MPLLAHALHQEEPVAADQLKALVLKLITERVDHHQQHSLRKQI